MRDIVKTLLGLGITVGLSDRESFVKQVSGILEGYQHDPEKAKKWAGAVVDYLEDTRNNINTESAFKSAFAGEHISDPGKIDELTAAIKELTKELQYSREKK